MSGFGSTIDTLLVAVIIASLVGLWLLWISLPRLLAFLRKPRRLGIVAGAVALVVFAAGTPVLITSFNLSRQRAAILRELATTDLNERNPATVELIEHGRVTVDGLVYAAPQLRQVGEQLFDKSSGKLVYADQIADFFLARSMPEWAPPAILNTPGVVLVLCIGAAIGAGAVLLGLAPMLGAVILAALAGASISLLTGNMGMLVAITGMVVLITGYGVLSRLLLRLLSRATPASAVANIVVRESTRQWYTGAFILILLVALPLVPLAIDAGPLRYRIQTFLSWSLGVTFGLAGLLTLVLSCATVALEIRDRQIWQTLTKPVARLRYILGKWMGVVLVNAVLLAVSGVSILLFIEYMRTRPAQDFMDEAAVRDEVLVARLGAYPVYQAPTPEQVLEKVDEQIAADPSMRADIDDGIRRESDIRRSLAEKIRSDFFAEQRMVPAGEARTFVFRGLERAKRLESNPMFSYKLHIGASDPHEQHPIIMRFKDGSWVDRVYVPAQRHSFVVPWQYIEDDGTLSIEIFNAGVNPDARDAPFFPGAGTMVWDADGIEVLFKVGNFEPNFIRAFLLEWIKLSFLAMLGICCATVLNFPVALLFTATIYLVGSLTPFLGVALGDYTVRGDDPMLVQAFQVVVKGIASATYYMLAIFGEMNGEALLVQGRLVSWWTVGWAAVTIGLVWTGLSAIIGLFAFRRKELAIYSGQGG